VGTVVELPVHLKWSGPTAYDVSDDGQAAALYSVVLVEGGEADVRRYVDSNRLLGLWHQVVLPPHVRRAWRDYFRLVGGVDPGP
jgi:hypothetical protein